MEQRGGLGRDGEGWGGMGRDGEGWGGVGRGGKGWKGVGRDIHPRFVCEILDQWNGPAHPLLITDIGGCSENLLSLGQYLHP